MMSIDRTFTKDQDFREISDSDLYYDLGYKLSKRGDQVVEQSSSVILYIFITSIVLYFIFDVYQFLTLVAIIIYGISNQYFTKVIGTRERAIGLTIILATNIFDHLLASLVVLPGSIIDTRLGTLAWVFEIIWIMLFGVEFLSIFAPVQQEITPERSVYPASENTVKSYRGLKRRVAGSEFRITDFDQEVDTSLLQRAFRDLVKYLVGIFIIIVILDILIWEIISIFSGGNNIEEAYFVSGISFIIYLAIIVYSANLFPEEKSDDKVEDT